MKSISIVYKLRQKNNDGEPLVNSVKRQVDEYYHLLLEKERVREEMCIEKQNVIENIRIKTAKMRKKQDTHELYSSLNVVPMSVKQQPQTLIRSRTSSQPRLLSLQKKCQSQKILRGLKRPQAAFTNAQEEKDSKSIHCKLKKMVKKSNDDQFKDTVIVVSANFIVNQHDFWSQEQIEEYCIRYWRELQSHAHIVWVCEKEATVKKLVKFSKIFNLRLDSVYLLQPQKNIKVPTVSFGLIQIQYNLKRPPKISRSQQLKQQRKMIIFSGLDIEKGAQFNTSSFFHAIPIVSNRKTVVHFVRIDRADKSRFGNIIKVLSEDRLPQLFNLNPLLKFQYSSKDDSKYSDCKCRHKSIDRQSTASKLEQIKVNLTEYFTQSLSLSLNDKVKVQNGQYSLQYMLGDMLRRNYRIFQEVNRYNRQYMNHRHMNEFHLKKKENELNRVRKRLEIGYNNFSYFWQF